MRRTVAVAALLLTTSCSVFGGSSDDATGELREIAQKGVAATYAATYRFTGVGRLAPGQTARLEIVQDPPTAIRMLETITPDAEGEPISLRSWQVRMRNKDYACTDYADVGIRCTEDPLAHGTFNSNQLDSFFDAPREEGVFSGVGKARRTLRIAGQVATCFQALEAEATPPPVTSPQPVATPDRFRYELCYTDDGILVRGRRTNENERLEEGEQRTQFVVEAISVRRSVRRADLKLPGPVTGPDELS